MDTRYLLRASVVAVLCLGSSRAFAAEPLKVICASRAATPPVIDGKLDDPCWRATEVRDDFGSVADSSPVKRRSTMRFVYDDQNLYMALEFFWDDITILEKGVAEILKKHGRPPEGVMSIKNYANRYGVELFLDRGATRANFYQVLFNAAGQWVGNFKARWECYKQGGQRFKSAIRGDRWVVEYVYPAKGLKPGDRWGLDVVRNDASYYAMWRHISGAFHQPAQFGTLVIGSYRDWWQTVSRRAGVKHLDPIGARLRAGPASARALVPLWHQVRQRAAELARVARVCPPTSRRHFETLYRAHADFAKDYNRLAGADHTLALVGRIR